MPARRMASGLPTRTVFAHSARPEDRRYRLPAVPDMTGDYHRAVGGDGLRVRG
jgi:hypothetical protein